MTRSRSSDGAPAKVSGYTNIDHAPVTSVLPDGDVPYTDQSMDADERVITALGYKQEFKREFSLWTTFCVSFAVLGLLPSFASTIYYGTWPYDPSISCQALTRDQEWAMPERQVWSGDGSLPCFLSNALQCRWRSYALPCLPGTHTLSCRAEALAREGLLTSPAAGSTMQQRYSRLQSTGPLQPGLRAGPTGLVRSLQRRPWVILLPR